MNGAVTNASQCCLNNSHLKMSIARPSFDFRDVSSKMAAFLLRGAAILEADDRRV